MCFQDSSETWTRPSTPPRSTNAPKLTIEETTPGADLALLQGGQEVLADLGLGLLEPRTAREHDVVAVLVQLDDLRLELLADVRLQVADAAHLDQRGGEEAAEADVEDEATLDDLDDGAVDDAVLFLDLLDRAPGALVLGALLGQDQAAFLVLLLEDQGLDLVADLDDLVGVDVVLDRQLAGGDDALGLVADVEEDLVAVDLDDDALDDVAVVEVLDRVVDRGDEVFGGADVVDGDLRGGGGSAGRGELGGGGHAGWLLRCGQGSDGDAAGTALPRRGTVIVTVRGGPVDRTCRVPGRDQGRGRPETCRRHGRARACSV